MRRLARSPVILLLILLFSCQKSGPFEPVEFTRFLMDTVVRIAVYDTEISREQAERAIGRAFDAMREVEEKTSSHKPDSDVSKLILASGDGWIDLSEETQAILRASVRVSESTDGAFDPTVGVAEALWGFDSDHPTVPTNQELNAVLPLIDYHQIELDRNRARLRQDGAGLDLGGIAKGFNIDRAIEVLRNEGVTSALVDAGGDLRIMGDHPKNKRWRIGIKHPRPKIQSLYGVIETGPVSIATSGDYERFFIRDGHRYHHILDPKTGMPASGCISVTIVTRQAVLADAYATAVFVMGPEKGMAFVESRPDLEGLILLEQGDELSMVISEGLKSKVQIL